MIKKKFSFSINNYKQALDFRENQELRFNLAASSFHEAQKKFLIWDNEDIKSRKDHLDEALLNLDMVLEEQPLHYDAIVFRADIQVELAKLSLYKDMNENIRVELLNDIMSDFRHSLAVLELHQNSQKLESNNIDINHAKVLFCRARANIALWGDPQISIEDFNKAIKLWPKIYESIKLFRDEVVSFSDVPDLDSFGVTRKNINFLISTNQLLNYEKWSKVFNALKDF